MICLILIFFNIGIPIKVIIDDKSVVIIKGIVKLLFLKCQSDKIQVISINPNKINTWLLTLLKIDIFFLSKSFSGFSKT